jgi:hypothetical protein
MTGHNIKYHQNKRNKMEELEGESPIPPSPAHLLCMRLFSYFHIVRGILCAKGGEEKLLELKLVWDDNNVKEWSEGSERIKVSRGGIHMNQM